MDKSPDAFRTISEVADWLDTPAHVLRFWESRFTQVKPVKRAGGRRYYRPADMALLGGIKKLLHDDGMTIRGVQKLLREHGVKYVSSLSPIIEGVEPITATPPGAAAIPSVPPAPMAEMVPQDDFDMPSPPEDTVVPFGRGPVADDPVAAELTERHADEANTGEDGPDDDSIDLTPHGYAPPAHVLEEEELLTPASDPELDAAQDALTESLAEAALAETHDVPPLAETADFALEFDTDVATPAAADMSADLNADPLPPADALPEALEDPLPEGISDSQDIETVESLDAPTPESLFAIRAEAELGDTDEPAPAPTAPVLPDVPETKQVLSGQTAFDFADTPTEPDALPDLAADPETDAVQGTDPALSDLPDMPSLGDLAPEDMSPDAEALAEYELPAPEAEPHEEIPDMAAGDLSGDFSGDFSGALSDDAEPSPDALNTTELPGADFGADFVSDLPADMAADIAADGPDDFSPDLTEDPVSEVPMTFETADSGHEPDLDPSALDPTAMADIAPELAPEPEPGAEPVLAAQDLPAFDADMAVPTDAEATATNAPLGALLDLPPDPSDDDIEIAEGHGILGLLKVRDLIHLPADQTAELLSRAEALHARLSEEIAPPLA